MSNTAQRLTVHGLAVRSDAEASPHDVARLAAKIDPGAQPDACWLWIAHTDPKGYAVFRWAGRMHRGHRVAFAWLVGPIPPGLVIDHLCRVTSCLNPAHLQAVTNVENMLRRRGFPAAVGADRRPSGQGWKPTGRPPGRNPTPLPQRLWAQVDKTAPDGCWLWTGATKNGYGAVYAAAGRSEPAHRVAYQLLVGPIPGGLVLDHLCRDRRCVNPEHLDPVTHAVNILRGTGTQPATPPSPTALKGTPTTRQTHTFTRCVANGTVEPAGGTRCAPPTLGGSTPKIGSTPWKRRAVGQP